MRVLGGVEPREASSPLLKYSEVPDNAVLRFLDPLPLLGLDSAGTARYLDSMVSVSGLFEFERVGSNRSLRSQLELGV